MDPRCGVNGFVAVNFLIHVSWKACMKVVDENALNAEAAAGNPEQVYNLHLSWSRLTRATGGVYPVFAAMDGAKSLKK